ncbi:MAG: hypothetical protein SNJ55_13420 [Chloroherpetonaceae bacterium]
MMKAICGLAVILSTVPMLLAQSQSEPIQVRGGISTSNEFYASTGIAPRLPSNINRAVLRMSVSIYEQVELPFELYLSNQQTTLQQPFNQFGVSPTFFGWLRFHAGYFNTQLSELTFGDARMLGGGVEIMKETFRFSVIYGRIRAALDADTTQQFYGQYSRRLFGVKLGFGNWEKGYFDVNVIRAIDDSTTIVGVEGVQPAHENLVVSAQTGFLMAERVMLRLEAAGALFSNDLRSEAVEKASLPSFIFTPRYSSQADFAATLNLNAKISDQFSLALNGRWIGPGFVSLGFVQLQNDVFQITIAPSLRFAKGRGYVRGSYGFQTNNLRNTRLAPTTRNIYALASGMQFSDNIALDAQYTNFGVRTAPRNDSLRIENISHALSISPRFTFQLFGSPSNLMLTYSYQNVDDQSILGGAVNQNQTQSAIATWSQSFRFPLTLATTALRNHASVGAARIKITSITETIGYGFLDGKLTTALTFGVNLVSNSATDTQWTSAFLVTYGMGRYGALSMNVSNNTFNTTSTLPQFRELQGSLQYNVNFN